MTAAALSWAEVAAWRSRRQHLDGRVPGSQAIAVAGELCGLHAQVMSSAALTLWTRVEDLDADAVPTALWKERTLVKTWAMRGTLHLLPAAELGLWHAAFSTFTWHDKASRLKGFGVTPAELERIVEAVGAALDGRELTREELAEEVARRTRSAKLGAKLRESWGSMLKPAAFAGQLCFAGSDGPRVRFARPDRWVGPSDPVEPDAAVREIVRRYLTTHGPATREDFARWWVASPAQAGRLIESLGDEVCAVDVEGTAAWMPRAEVSAAAGAAPTGSVRLLPAFDPYVIAATKHARHLLPSDHAGRVYRPQGWLTPVLAVDGRMDGVWRHERKGKRLVVTIEPFVKLKPRVRRATEEEAERLAGFLGGTLELAWA